MRLRPRAMWPPGAGSAARPAGPPPAPAAAAPAEAARAALAAKNDLVRRDELNSLISLPERVREAIESGECSPVLDWIGSDANVDVRDAKGRTALMLATTQGRDVVVQALLLPTGGLSSASGLGGVGQLPRMSFPQGKRPAASHARRRGGCSSGPGRADAQAPALGARAAG